METVFNRLVPKWLFRFSVGDVFDLDFQLLQESSNRPLPSDYSMACIEDDHARLALREFTWNSVPLESTQDDFGYAVLKTSELDSPRDQAEASSYVGGVWAGTGSFSEADLGFRIDLQPSQAWLYCAFVDKEARGGGLYKKLLGFVAEDLQSRDYQRLSVIIQPWNKASIHVHRSLSRRRVGRVCVVKLLGFAWVFCSGEISQTKRFTASIEGNPVILKV